MIRAVIGGALEPEMVVGDRYRLRRRLGEGGMGWVWEARHVFTHARFALKFLKGAREEDRRRFVREVRAAAAVKHPNVIGVHDFVELPDGTLVMVMDLLEGETLGARLRRDGRIGVGDLAAILLPVVEALEAAHAVGIVHRDLKPDNVFLSERTAEEGVRDVQVKVLDFGIAKLTALDGLAARTQALTGTGSMLGTPYYMSPEQIVSEKDVDGRADIWSLGIVMYECLAGVRPTEADNVGRVLKRILLGDFASITDHCADLPGDVAALVTRMLVGDRDQRLGDLSEVRAVLSRHASAGVAPPARATSAAGVDAHADTVASADTHHAVSMGASHPARARVLRAAGTAAVIAAVAVVGWSLAARQATPPAPVLTMPATRPDLTVVSTTPVVPAMSGPGPSASASAEAPASAAPLTKVSSAPQRRAPSPTLPPAVVETPQAAEPFQPTPAASAPSPSSSERPKAPPVLAKTRKD